MGNYIKSVKRPLGGSTEWVDQSIASTVLNNDFFRIELSTLGYIKVWTRSSWELKPVKVWNGVSWEIKPVKMWSGSNWVEI